MYAIAIIFHLYMHYNWPIANWIVLLSQPLSIFSWLFARLWVKLKKMDRFAIYIGHIIILQFQVKSEVDLLFVLVSQYWYLVALGATSIRAIYGPLPYYVVVVLVELLKMILALNLAVLNASYIIQFFIIFDFRWDRGNKLTLEIRTILIIPGYWKIWPGLTNFFFL